MKSGMSFKISGFFSFKDCHSFKVRVVSLPLLVSGCNSRCRFPSGANFVDLTKGGPLCCTKVRG